MRQQIVGIIFLASAAAAFSQVSSTGAAANAGQNQAAGRGPAGLPAFYPALFFKEDFQKLPGTGEAPAVQANLANPNLELKIYGADAKDLLISGGGTPANPINLWNGLTQAPTAITLRDKNNFVDLTGLAKIKWVTRVSGFHVVRPVIKLADGTLLVGDHVDANPTAFLESEFAFAAVRWMMLDPQRVVTRGASGSVGGSTTWVENPDLSRVDEVGFTDLMPGSGHGAGGWINVAHIEVYGKAVKR